MVLVTPYTPELEKEDLAHMGGRDEPGYEQSTTGVIPAAA